MYDSHIKFNYIDNEVWTKQTVITGKNVKKIGVQHSTMRYNLNSYKNKQKYNHEAKNE